MSGANKLYKNMIYLRTATDARRFISRVINRLNDSEDPITQGEARTFGYLIKCFLDCLEAADFEERLAKLEEAVSGEERNQDSTFRGA